MARETKIGVALMALLIGVFGFVVYRKWDSLKPVAVAAADGEQAAPTKKATPDPKPADGEATEPPSNPFAAITASDAPPTGQAEPADPFAGVVATDRVPIREVSATSTDNWAPPEGEAFSRREPASGKAGAAPPAQGEPGEAFAESSTDVAPSSPASAEPAALADDPFGDVAASPAAAGAGPSPAADPFAEGDLSEPSEETVAADATDPFGEAEAAPEVAASVPAEGGASEFEEPHAVAAAEDDPFSEAEAVGAGTVTDTVVTFDAATAAGADAAGTELAGIEPESGGPFEPAAPSRAEMAATAPAGVDHVVVEENENYWSISKRVYGTPAYFHALAKYNESRIRDPKRLRPGMMVLTPAAEELAARYPKLISGGGGATPTEDADRPGFLVDAEGRPAYRVGKDDTLGKIAQDHLGRASRWIQIYEMNRGAIPNAKALKPGTVLRLPGDASRVRLASKG